MYSIKFRFYMWIWDWCRLIDSIVGIVTLEFVTPKMESGWVKAMALKMWNEPFENIG